MVEGNYFFRKVERTASSPADVDLTRAREALARQKLLRQGIDSENQIEGVRNRRKPKKFSLCD